MKRLLAAVRQAVAPTGSGKGSPSWTAYRCRHVKNGHVCRRDQAEDHRVHPCLCGLIAWAT